jgi:hypothetical protein
MTWRAMGWADIARRVKACYPRNGQGFVMHVDDVAIDMCQGPTGSGAPPGAADQHEVLRRNVGMTAQV